MRVAVDARPAAFPARTGVGTYAWHLLRLLPEVDPDTTYVAWYLHARRLLGAPSPFAGFRRANLTDRGVPIPARLFDASARALAVPRVEWFAGFDVLFAPNFIPPPTRAHRAVVTVHDLAFRMLRPSAPERTQRWLAGLDRTLAGATRVIVPSEATREDLLGAWPLLEDRVRVIAHGVDHDTYRPSPGGSAGPLRPLGVEGPYLLYVGGIEPRKNLPRLIEAFAGLPPDGPSLVVVGSGVRWNPEGRSGLQRALRAAPENVRRRVLLLGHVSERDKVQLMWGAVALVNPTLYEGFGLQVLEAMACGTPVLASATGAVPAVAGDAAVLVDPLATEDIRAGMERLLSDEPLRVRLRTAGLERASRFSWRRTAEQTARALREAADDG